MDFPSAALTYPILVLSLLDMSHGIVLSESCRMEKIALQQNEVLQEKFMKNVRSYESVKAECKSDENSVACVYDYTETADELGDICIREGGQFLAMGFGAFCGDDRKRMEVYYNKYPLCYGIRCEHDDVASLIKSHIDELEKSITAHGFDCEMYANDDIDTESSARHNFAAYIPYALFIFHLIMVII